MPIIVLFFFMLFIASAAQLETTRDDARQGHLAESRHDRTIKLAELVSRYLDEKKRIPPASLTALAATPGFEEARQYLNDSGPQGDGPFLESYLLNNGVNDYNRVIVYNPPIDGSISAINYLAASYNSCGTTAPSDKAVWCGDPSGSWWMTETLSHIPDELSRERAQQQQTLQKFAKIYSVIIANKQVFPEPTPGGNDSAVTLISQLTSYGFNANNCKGVWLWKGVPLTCEDLYTVWGTPRIYNYKTEDYIALYAEAPWREKNPISNLPEFIVVASQLDSRR